MKLLSIWQHVVLFAISSSLVHARLMLTNTVWTAVTIGQPFTITWTDSTSNPPSSVSLILQSGSSADLTTVETIVSGVKAPGSYTWTPESSLSTDSTYAIRIEDDNDSSDFNFSPQFQILGDTGASSGGSSGGGSSGSSSGGSSIPSSSPTQSAQSSVVASVATSGNPSSSTTESKSTNAPGSSKSISSSSSQSSSTTQPPSSSQTSSSSESSLSSSTPSPTSSASSSNTAQPSASQSKKSGLSAGAAAAIAIAALLGLLALIVLAWFLIRRRRKRPSQTESGTTHPTAPELSAGDKTLAAELGPPLNVEEEAEWKRRKRAAELEGKSTVLAELDGNPRAELEVLRRAAEVYEMH